MDLSNKMNGILKWLSWVKEKKEIEEMMNYLKTR